MLELWKAAKSTERAIQIFMGQTPGIAAVPLGRATFRGALPGVARPSGNEGAGVARGAPGGGAVAAVALSRGRAKNRFFSVFPRPDWILD